MMHSFSAINEMFLVEDKVRWLKDNHQEPDSISTAHDTAAEHTEPHAIIDHFASHDPHPKKAYTPWMVGQYKKGNIRQEDAGRTGQTLGNFDKYKGKLEKKDIGQYKHPADVDDAVAPHLGGASSKKEEKRNIKLEGADLLHDANGLSVHHIKTEEAAKLYGKGAKWCTNGENGNMFNHYNKQGPLHAIHTDDGNKFQFHFASNQFMDPQDRPVAGGLGGFAKKYPEIRNVQAFKGLHPALEQPEDYNRRIAGGHVYKAGGQNGIGLDKEAKILTPKTLESAYKHWDQEGPLNTSTGSHLGQIAQHPNTPSHVLHSLATRQGERFPSQIASHPNATAETLDHVYKGSVESGKSGDIGAKVAAHPNVSDKTKEAMIGDHNMHGHLLDNPSLTHEQVSRIHGVSLGNTNKMQQSTVHEKIASHLNTHPDTLHDLAHGSNHLAASNAIANPKLSADSHRSLYDLGKAPIHAAQAKNANTPKDVLGKLTSHPLPFVADTAKKTLAKVK